MSQQLINNFKEFLEFSLGQNAVCKKKMGQFVFPIERDAIFSTSKNIFFMSESQFFWKKPKEGIFLHSIGRIDLQKVFGFNHLIFTKETFDNLKLQIMTNQDSEVLKRIPLFCGNSSFAPLSGDDPWNCFFNFNWFIPKLLLLLDTSTSYLVYNFSLETEKKLIIDEFFSFLGFISPLPSAKGTYKPYLKNRKDMDFDKWETLVGKALSKIRGKSFSKVVLSRKTEFDFDGEFQPGLLDEIALKYPDCITFFNKSDDSIFFGITPERLLKISGGIIETESLAGSIKRSGKIEEDLLLSEQLLSSNKNLMEQQYVTDYIISKLNIYAGDISFNKEPELIKLENIQHLKTHFKAKLKKDKFFFDLVGELQPTPAVCGYPKQQAYEFILENEEYERGLYSGITGWFNLFEEGEFAVAIRSALITGKKLYAFTGCGIVEGSNAESEFEETEIKLKPIFSIFGYEN